MTISIAHGDNKVSLSLVGGLLFLLLGCGPTDSTASVYSSSERAEESPTETLNSQRAENSSETVSSKPQSSERAPSTAEPFAESPIGEPLAIAPDSAKSTSESTGEPATAESTVEVANAETEVTQLLYIAGIEDAQAVRDFVEEMRSGAIANNREALVSLVRYPFTTYSAGTPVKTYETSADLLNDFDQVLTPAVLEAMSQASYADLFVNSDGAMIGNGEVWFGQFEEGLRIRAINPI